MKELFYAIVFFPTAQLYVIKIVFLYTKLDCFTRKWKVLGLVGSIASARHRGVFMETVFSASLIAEAPL